jgi:hypothetical protein
MLRGKVLYGWYFFILINDFYFRTQQKMNETMEIKKEAGGSQNKS